MVFVVFGRTTRDDFDKTEGVKKKQKYELDQQNKTALTQATQCTQRRLNYAISLSVDAN